LGLVVALASWAHPLGYYNPLSYYFSVAELKALDSQFDLRRPLPASSPIVIVAVDEDSFDALDLRWPWPRERHAEFIDIVNRGRPAVHYVAWGIPALDAVAARAIATAGAVPVAVARSPRLAHAMMRRAAGLRCFCGAMP